MRAIQDKVRRSCTAALVGTSIVVTGVDFDGDERHRSLRLRRPPHDATPVYNPN